MIRIFIVSIFFSFFFIKSVSSTNIAVVDIDNIINSNLSYNKIINEIKIEQKEISQSLEVIELQLSQALNEIEESKLLLDEVEISKMVKNYNEELLKYNNLIEEFNLHYQNEIIEIRKKIIEEIIVLLEKYANESNIDLIIDSTSYLIASNAINITNVIEKQINMLELKLEFENFEKN